MKIDTAAVLNMSFIGVLLNLKPFGWEKVSNEPIKVLEAIN